MLTPLPAAFVHKVSDLGLWNIDHGSNFYCDQSWMDWNRSQEVDWVDVHMNEKWLSYELSVGRIYWLPAVAASNKNNRRVDSGPSGQSIMFVEVFFTWFPGS